MPLTVLVADDDLGTRLSIGDYLEICGYSVITAQNGKQALGLVEEYQPHLIVTDVTMPEMDGYEFVRRVRLRPAFRLLPVIFLTERTSTQERIRGYQLGADNYLRKPFELEELGAVIRSLLDRYALIAQAGGQGSGGAGERGSEGAGERGGGGDSDITEKSLSLTQREKDVLQLLTDGLSNAQIGDRLHLSHRTVEKYVSSLLRKSDRTNRAELVRFAMEHHLVD
ncbi:MULTISPECIES: response regulator transcription factor [Kamptonema]|uniref:response regulator transcription factor n=2 Tax=Microcoleaceae TaxID=1892252 RepID=UPI0001DAC639|nr:MULTISPECIES: response regulator transcription factor [Kamptonema]CBN53772.1 Two component transcriptional regulator, LuxR family [Kamptonema sp. PCC 6506]